MEAVATIKNAGHDLERSMSLINKCDLTPVANRLIHIYKWKPEHANTAVAQYRRYLILRLKYPEQILPPSPDMDEAWHAHILHTQDYVDFCDEVYGCYLHHKPKLSLDGKPDWHLIQSFHITQELHKREFGSYITAARPRPVWLAILRTFVSIFKKDIYNNKKYLEVT